MTYKLRLSLGLVTLSSLARVSGTALKSNGYTTSSISWTPCGNTTVPRECGQFKVPLDYGDKKAGTATLAVARINATSTPRLGTLFVNPGGPGESGVSWVLSDDILLMMEGAGGQYDIVSWDPRGVGSTIPKVQCFSSADEEKAFWNGSIRETSLELRTNFSDPAVRNEFYSHVNETDQALIKFGKRCNVGSQNMLKYVGTAATVRDMVALHDHLEGTKEINYWGISYGTVLGNYFVNMFPNRVGRVIIDGVANTHIWATRPPLEIIYETLDSADATFYGFASSCLNAGPSKCAISGKGSSPSDLYNWVLDLIALAYDHTKATGGTIITSGQLRALTWANMYHPRAWPILAQTLAQVSTMLESPSNSSSLASREFSELHLERRAAENDSILPPEYPYQAISCADAIDDTNTTKAGFEVLVDAMSRNISQMFIPVMGWNAASMYCQRWPVRAVERFTGPFNHKLQNKILVIGNLADPITPFISAKKVADELGDSAVLLKHNGYGHTSLYMRSNCTVGVTQNYFINGVLPSSGTVCEERNSGKRILRMDNLLISHPVFLPLPEKRNSNVDLELTALDGSLKRFLVTLLQVLFASYQIASAATLADPNTALFEALSLLRPAWHEPTAGLPDAHDRALQVSAPVVAFSEPANQNRADCHQQGTGAGLGSIPQPIMIGAMQGAVV